MKLTKSLENKSQLFLLCCISLKLFIINKIVELGEKLAYDVYKNGDDDNSNKPKKKLL